MLKMPKQYCVCILTNQRNTVLYTGVTGELQRRVYQHRGKLLPALHPATTSQSSSTMNAPKIRRQPSREKQIKAGSRRKKIDLVTGFNPQWRDLFDDLQ
jgi:putative endonuclease